MSTSIHGTKLLVGWPFPTLKYENTFQIKYTDAILSNSTRKLLWSEITGMLIAVFERKKTRVFIIISGTLSFPLQTSCSPVGCYTRQHEKYQPITTGIRGNQKKTWSGDPEKYCVAK